MRSYFAWLKKQNLAYRIYTLRIYIYGCIALVCVGVYVGFLLFGDNSLDVLLKNVAQRDALRLEVQELQNNNARLQKELFELRGLEP